MKTWVFLSAHFDDVVLSVGGLVWELSQAGDRVEIWTICAGDPPSGKPLTAYAQMLHEFWGIGEDVPKKRSVEDADCCRVLGASAFRRYTVPDNIYRYLPGTDDALIIENDDQFTPLEPLESYLIPPVADFILKNLPSPCELVSPLSIGSHKDHVLTRKAAERAGLPLWYYADYPYLIYGEHKVQDWVPSGAEVFSKPVSQEGLNAWQQGFLCQRSQIPLIFIDEDNLYTSIASYCQSGYGGMLWHF